MKEELLEKRKKIRVTEAGVDWGAEKNPRWRRPGQRSREVDS